MTQEQYWRVCFSQYLQRFGIITHQMNYSDISNVRLYVIDSVSLLKSIIHIDIDASKTFKFQQISWFSKFCFIFDDSNELLLQSVSIHSLRNYLFFQEMSLILLRNQKHNQSSMKQLQKHINSLNNTNTTIQTISTSKLNVCFVLVIFYMCICIFDWLSHKNKKPKTTKKIIIFYLIYEKHIIYILIFWFIFCCIKNIGSQNTK
jgi:hypothetical protein